MKALLIKVCAFRFFDTFILIYPLYLVMFVDRGLRPVEIGTVLASWSAACLLLEIPSGVLADRFPRRLVLFGSQAARAVGFLAWLLFPTFWGSMVGLVLWGVKSALMSGTFEALVYDELAARGRAEAYAWVIGRAQAFRYVGVLLASLAAAAAAGWGYGPILIASLVSGLICAAVALILPAAPKTLAVGRSYLGLLRQGLSQAVTLPGVLRLAIFISAIQALVVAQEENWPIFGREIGLSTSAIALFVAAGSGAQGLASSMAHRLEQGEARTTGALIVVLGLLAISAALLFDAWGMALAMVFSGLYRVIDINLDARFQHAIPQDTRATLASVKGFATQGVTTVLIFGFGAAAQAGGYRTAFALGAALTLLLGLGQLLTTVRRR